MWGQKKVIPVNGGKQVYGKCIGRIREIYAGGGSKDSRGAERRKQGRRMKMRGRDEDPLLGGKRLC